MIKQLILILLLLIFHYACSNPFLEEEKSQNTSITIIISNTCEDNFYVTTGTIQSISTDWESNTISIQPSNQVNVDVPEGGAYRIYFSYDSNSIWISDSYWDLTINVSEGQNRFQTLTCTN